MTRHSMPIRDIMRLVPQRAIHVLRDTCTTLHDGAHYVTNARAFKHNVRAFKHNVRAFKHNVRAFKHNVRAFKHNVRAFKHNVRAFKHNVRAFKHNISHGALGFPRNFKTPPTAATLSGHPITTPTSSVLSSLKIPSHQCFYRTIRSYHINTSLSLLIGPLALSSGLEYILITSKAFSVFHLKASSKHPGQFQYFISKLLQNIQDNFRRPFDSLDILNLFLLQHPSNIQDIFNYQDFLLTAGILGTSDILQDSWSSSNAIQQAFYKGFTFLLIGSLHSNGFTF
ncbi:hypothetical protein BU17DRAFT_62272 [Hysterangium stoloniferum]|nr:hypothetical protein BU17DRAFT_62272 [Hysterangium stoloniferum]